MCRNVYVSNLVHVVVKLIDILELLLAGDLSMICDKIIDIVTTSYGNNKL